MDVKHKVLSETRINRIIAQGYCNYSNEEISALAFGNRFAYMLCFAILLIGVVAANIPILIVMTIVAFGGIIFPYHPFDYIYNYGLRIKLNKPKLPPRSKQLKFGCIIATIWLTAITYMFYSGYNVAGYVNGGLMASISLLVSTTDFCIPSTVYNFIFQ